MRNPGLGYAGVGEPAEKSESDRIYLLTHPTRVKKYEFLFVLAHAVSFFTSTW